MNEDVLNPGTKPMFPGGFGMPICVTALSRAIFGGFRVCWLSCRRFGPWLEQLFFAFANGCVLPCGLRVGAARRKSMRMQAAPSRMINGLA